MDNSAETNNTSVENNSQVFSLPQQPNAPKLSKKGLWILGIFLCVGLIIAGFVFWFNSSNKEDQIDNLEEWTIMVYMGGDNNLEDAAINNFNEMEKVGSSSKVNIIVQFDRSPQYDLSNGDWTTTKRFFVKKDTDPTRITSEELSDLGEIDMTKSESLYDFLKWGYQTYPAKKTVLILWDHGGGWQSMLNDDTDNPKGMNLKQLQTALKKYKDVTKEKLSIIDFDMCLMAQIEVDSVISDFANIRIASEELEPNEGIDYKTVLEKVVAKPTMKPDEFSRLVVTSFKDFYEKKGKVSGITLSAVNLEKIPQIIKLLTDFSDKVSANSNSSWKETARAMGSVETFARDRLEFGSIDLSDFIDLFETQSVITNDLKQITTDLKKTINEAVIANTNGNAHPYSHGIAIYFPVEKEYYDKDYALSSSFAATSKWASTLSNFYRARSSAKTPTPIVSIDTPPASVKSGESLVIDYTVDGKDLYDVRYFTILQKGNTDIILEENFPREQTDQGYVMDSYADGTNEKSLQWPSTSVGLTNGKKTIFTTMHPYGRVLGNFSLYYTQGMYRSKKYGFETPVTLVFDYVDNTMVYAWAYIDYGDGIISPLEITHEEGDEFIPFEEQIDAESGEIQSVLSEIDTITFAKNGLQPVETLLDEGDYFVLVQAEDLTGKIGFDYVNVKVE